MNKGKTQFISVMSYQRRKPSRRAENVDSKFGKKMEVEVGGSMMVENDVVKPLGVTIDRDINFKSHWEKVRGEIGPKIFGLLKVRSNLSFQSRKSLCEGLVRSRLNYCLSATSCCAKTTLEGPGRIMNKLVRLVSGHWQREETRRGSKRQAGYPYRRRLFIRPIEWGERY